MATQAASVALLLVVLLRSSESVGVKAAVLMLLLLIAVSGMLTTQHFAQLISPLQGNQLPAATPQQSRQQPGPQSRPQTADSQRRRALGEHTLLAQRLASVLLPALSCHAAMCTTMEH